MQLGHFYTWKIRFVSLIYTKSMKIRIWWSRNTSCDPDQQYKTTCFFQVNKRTFILPLSCIYLKLGQKTLTYFHKLLLLFICLGSFFQRDIPQQYRILSLSFSISIKASPNHLSLHFNGFNSSIEYFGKTLCGPSNIALQKWHYSLLTRARIISHIDLCKGTREKNHTKKTEYIWHRATTRK